MAATFLRHLALLFPSTCGAYQHSLCFAGVVTYLDGVTCGDGNDAVYAALSQLVKALPHSMLASVEGLLCDVFPSSGRDAKALELRPSQVPVTALFQSRVLQADVQNAVLPTSQFPLDSFLQGSCPPYDSATPPLVQGPPELQQSEDRQKPLHVGWQASADPALEGSLVTHIADGYHEMFLETQVRLSLHTSST